MMKNILKSLGTGLLFGLMSLAAYAFGNMTVETFVAMPSSVGWEAVGLTVAGLIMGFMTLLIVFMMGAIPLCTINELKLKLREQEEDSKRDYEALYKAATLKFKEETKDGKEQC